MKLTMFFISCTVSIGGTQMFDKFAFGFFESAFYIALIAGGAACALATGADLLKEN